MSIGEQHEKLSDGSFVARVDNCALVVEDETGAACGIVEVGPEAEQMAEHRNTARHKAVTANFDQQTPTRAEAEAYR